MPTEVVGVDCFTEAWCSELIEISVIGKEVSIPVLEILRLISYEEGDLIFLSGSLIEGIGNLLSDLDVYVLKKNKLQLSTEFEASHDLVREFSSVDSFSGKSVSTYDYLPEYELNIEVEYWTAEEIDCLIKGVNRNSFESARFGLSPGMNIPSFKASRLVHNIVTATPLVGHEHLASLVDSFHLPSYCFMRFNSLAGSYEDFKDIAGVYMSGDILRAYDLAREYVTVQMQALTHLHFNTNFRRKWLLTYLQKLPSDYDGIVARYTELVYKSSGVDSLQDKFVELVEFLRDVFTAFGSTLDNSPAFSKSNELIESCADFAESFSDAETQRIIEFRRTVIGNKVFDTAKMLSKSSWG
ncbi:hypothetical protein FGA82_20450 [Pseudomonas fluorescens]|uniref:hypothetical protein n=1 Tax=Pseudomonas fluorescens TaxID=294 RepID=UPI0011316B41|nr:hypothetical protein [Pseudomonas fluorescens]TMU75620.1 hypothetical protein FGA82_20450 [Pseudomonas fluorescens]